MKLHVSLISLTALLPANRQTRRCQCIVYAKTDVTPSTLARDFVAQLYRAIKLRDKIAR